MAFCGNCGTRLDGNERFCVACGAGVPAQPAAAPSGAAVPVPVAAAAAIPAPVVAIPAPVGPMGTGAPQAPAAGGSKMWLVLVALVVLAGGYYLWQHRTALGNPSGQPSVPGRPAQQQDPTVLIQQQSFSGHWRAIYGFVELTNTSWTNHASVAIQSATLECDQFAANGNKLSEMQMKLNGPVAPGATATFNPFQMGSVSTYMTRVTCSIVAVVPAS